jgi:hypothetical protein
MIDTLLRRLPLLLLVAFVACRPAQPPSVGEPPSTTYFEDPRWASLIQQAREQLLELKRAHGWTDPERKILLAPLGGEHAPAAASALSWWLLRFESGLLPQRLESEQQSVAELQALSRRDVGSSREYWLLDLVGTEPARFELVVVQGGSVLRSGEFSVWRDEQWTRWPLDPTAAIARLEGVGARGLRREADTVLVETEDGLAPLSLRNGALRLGRVERTPRMQGPLPQLPVLELTRGDARLVWSQRISAGGACVEGWSLSRLGATLSLPLRRPSASPLLALASLPTSEGERWLVLRENGDLEMHPVSMRVANRSRATRLRAQPPLFIEAPPVSTSSRDPLNVWAASAGHAPLRYFAGSLDEAGRRWDARDGAAAAAVAAALRQRMAAVASQPAWSWLVDPLGETRVRAMGGIVEIDSGVSVGDLRDRLDHPLLWLGLDAASPASFAPENRAWSWSGAAESAALDCHWPRSIGEGPQPQDGAGSVAVAIIPSAAAAASARAWLAHLLGGRGLPELFAQSAPEWEARGPLSHRPWREIMPQGEVSSVAPLHLMLQVDPTILSQDERTRLLRRLEVLLDEHDVALSEVAPGENPRVGSSTVVARLARLALYSEEPLLRAVELGSWCGEREPPPQLRAAFALPRGHPKRLELAAAAERRLVESAAFIVLWRERWSCDRDGRLLVGPEWNALLPPWLDGLRWHPAADFSFDADDADDAEPGPGP